MQPPCPSGPGAAFSPPPGYSYRRSPPAPAREGNAMFESVEVGNKVEKAAYKVEVARLRADLLAAQHELAGADFSVLITVSGVAGAGKSEVVNLLLEWLDARGGQRHAVGEPTDEEAQRPPMWRFWRRLPPKGRMAVFFGSWDAGPLLGRARGRISAAALDVALDRVVEFEQM